MMKSRFLVLLLAAQGCAGRHFASVATVERCVAAAPASSAETAPLPWSAGRYRLLLVLETRARGLSPVVWEEGTMSLSVPSDSQLAASTRKGRFQRPRRNLQLVGSERSPSYPRPDPVEVDADILYLGCRDCLDGSPTVLILRGTSGRRSWGTWRDPQSGIVILADPETGEPLKESGGTFCVERMES